MGPPAHPTPGVVALFCLWTLWAAASGFPQLRPHSLDDLDMAKLEKTQEMFKRMALGDPLMSLAAKLSERRMQRFLHQDPQIAPVEFLKKPRNGRNIEGGH
ncbi:neuromedin-S isoform X2 [Ornithorhynchus anatinus]|uniref:neuromedin-S isoform X2 n=1 Tax=Ornithorhynchus anatinus TaxID=9258 RepID=UPI0010A78673|nr:neuromedin-S isoform X2 [Ornithorhynchus anatinus]